MPRKPLIRSNFLPYHITARGNNKEPFPCGPHEAWKIFNKELMVIHEQFEVKIHAFVTRSINSKTGRTGRIFGGRYHWSLVGTELYYDCALKYIYRNPVRANLVSSVEEYDFSSLKSVLGYSKSNFPLESMIWCTDIIPGKNEHVFLNWLNQPLKSEDEAAIKKGFRRLNFTPPNILGKKIRTDLSLIKFNA